MPPKKQPTIWKAEPHTIAKIEILRGYLQPWLAIFGRRARGIDLLYVDGFAGPGRYTNSPIGSPVAALQAAVTARSAAGDDWIAGTIHCAFIESDRKRFEHLRNHLTPFDTASGVQVHLYHDPFVEGISSLKSQMPQFFARSWPLLVFIDPFGATGAPFAVVESILSSERSEVLLNFDADAVARIFEAGVGANHAKVLREIYGDESWEGMGEVGGSFPDLCRRAVATYKRRLRSIRNVEYVFSFEMMNKTNSLSYDLIFASQHAVGLEKMKEAMKRIDQRGDYSFSDGRVGHQTLFRFDDPKEFARLLHRQFAGKTVGYREVIDFALNETPFTNAKSMLKILEKSSAIEVESSNPKRRRGSFPEATVKSITFS